jgi:hypothetical protein
VERYVSLCVNQTNRKFNILTKKFLVNFLQRYCVKDSF